MTRAIYTLPGILVNCFSLLIVEACNPLRDNPAKIIQEAKESVVLITAYDANDDPLLQGTGFFISATEVITNRHVIEGARRITVKTQSKRELDANFISATAKEIDLITLKVDTRNEKPSYLRLSTENVGDGDKIIVVGSPLGLEGTVSEGIVSSLREISGKGRLIQMTAAISHGSSGSPVLNMDGKVIGIATSSLTEGQNLNFAIPVGVTFEMLPETLLTVTEWRKRTLKELSKREDSEKRRLARIRIDSTYNCSSSTPYLSSVSRFDELGNIIEQKYFDDEGTMNSRTLYKFNELHQNSRIDYFDKGLDASRSLLSYDSEGRLAMREDWVSNRISSTRKYFYDNEGLPIKQEYYDSLGTLTWRYESRYDYRKNIVEYLRYNRSDMVAHVTYSDNKYDAIGSLSEVRSSGYDWKGTLNFESLNIYDFDGLLTKNIYKSHTSKNKFNTTITLYNYDKRGNISVVERSDDIGGKSTTSTSYDLYGNRVEILAVDSYTFTPEMNTTRFIHRYGYFLEP